MTLAVLSWGYPASTQTQSIKGEDVLNLDLDSYEATFYAGTPGLVSSVLVWAALRRVTPGLTPGLNASSVLWRSSSD